MNELPKVSVYIPTHDRVDLLISRALPSVIRQTYKNLEIIVVAHGCTDGTEEWVERVSDRRLRVVSVPIADESKYR